MAQSNIAVSVGQAAPDPIRQLLADLQRDRERLRGLKDPTTQKLSLEINDTLLVYLDDTVRHQIALRDELLTLRHWLNRVIPDIGARVDDLEADVDAAASGGLDDELILLFMEIVTACKEFVTAALEQGGAELNEQQKVGLTALLTKCDRANEELDALASGDDDDDDDDDGDAAEPGAAAVVTGDA